MIFIPKTINGQNIVITLEEMQLDYNLHIINLMKGEQTNPEFLKLNTSGRIPTIIDHSNDLSISQSSAILIYVAEKSGLLLSNNLVQKTKKSNG